MLALVNTHVDREKLKYSRDTPKAAYKPDVLTQTR